MNLKSRMFFSIIPTVFILTVCCPLYPVIHFVADTACAAEVTMAWDANSESNLAGYKLYYESETDAEFYQGTDANEGVSPITIYLDELANPNLPSYTVSGLLNGQVYYFVLTAFDLEGAESDFSDEIGVTAMESDGSYSTNNGGSACFISETMGKKYPVR